MNRYLLAGCAAVALAAGCGAASAADAVPVTSASGAHILINGDAYFEGAYVNAEQNAGNRNIDFRNRLRVNIIPDFKADNGLEYGARLRIRNGGNSAGETTSANIDRAYIFLKGMFGEVDLGQTDGPDDNIGAVIPNSVGTGFGIDGDWSAFVPTNDVTGTFLGDRAGISGDRSTKIAYYSPVFSGFQLAVAYTPQQNSSGYSPNLSQNNTGTNKYRDIYEVDALYNGTLGPVGLSGNVAYSGAEAADVAGSTGNKDLKSVKAGLDVTYGGFVVGGEYVNSFKSGYSKSISTHQLNQQAWSAGVQYATGPFTLAAAYAKGLSSTAAGGRHINLYSAGVDYKEAAGLTTGIEWDHYQGKADGGTVGDHGDIVIITQKLSF